jgi:ribonuclease P protein component
VLSRQNRLTASQAFSQTVRQGRRAGTRTLVVHLDVDAGTETPRVGLVVSKAVGAAVTRTVVKRRLRHLSRERLGALPRSAVLVLRALPASGTASYSELGADLDRALRRALAEGRMT